MYDPVIGRWHVVDPMSESFFGVSPYNYVLNDPINYTDPTGMYPYGPHGNHGAPGLDPDYRLKQIQQEGLRHGIPDWAWDSGGGIQDVLFFEQYGMSRLDAIERQMQYQAWRSTLSALNISWDPSTYYVKSRGISLENFENGRMIYDFSVVKRNLPSNSELYGRNGILNGIQTGLDVAGLIPVAGEVADGINSLIYLARGDYLNAGLSAAAMIPFAGWGATGAKLGMKAAKTVANTSGWVKRSVFNSLDPAIQKKVAAAIEKGIVAPTGKQGIIKLTATEAAQTGYQYKVKILGKGGDMRIYGNPMENGHIFFDKIMGALKKLKMKIEGMQKVLLLLYNKAKQKFEECINDEDNKFLKEEVSISLHKIVIIEKDIKIVFSQRDFEQYLFEVSLILFDGQKEIGKYLYIENEKEEAIDDSLVFY